MVGKTSLRAIISPYLPKGFADYRDHAPHPSTLERILRGADGSLEKLISKYEWYLGWLDITNAVHCVDTLTLFQAFLGPRPVPLHMEQYQRLLQSDAYWKMLFGFLKRAANHWQDTSDESHRCVGDQSTARILTTTAKTLGEYRHYPIAQCDSLLQALMSADLFGRLDDVLPIYAKRYPPYVPRTFCLPVRDLATAERLIPMSSGALMMILERLGFLVRENPSSAAILRPHLPRPKSLAALLIAAYFKDGKILTATPLSDADIKERTDHFSIQTNFHLLAQLEEACRLESECGRRGCTNEMHARCSVCRTMVYCGPACQKR